MRVLIAFLGGIISFISPCVLPMIPMYISYISGLSVSEIKGEKRPVFRIFINSLFFVLGFTIIFTLLAALLYLFINSMGNFKIWFNRIAGLVVVIFGLHVMGVINLPFLNYQMKMNTGKSRAGLLSSFIMGIAFGAGWTPCIGPVLVGILFTSASAANPWGAVFLLVVFSLGIGIPFILTGLLTGKLLRLFEGIKKHYKVVEIISGIFLVIIGVLIFFDWMGLLSGWLTRVLPGLSKVEHNFMNLFQKADAVVPPVTNQIIEQTNSLIQKITN